MTLEELEVLQLIGFKDEDIINKNNELEYNKNINIIKRSDNNCLKNLDVTYVVECMKRVFA